MGALTSRSAASLLSSVPVHKPTSVMRRDYAPPPDVVLVPINERPPINKPDLRPDWKRGKQRSATAVRPAASVKPVKPKPVVVEPPPTPAPPLSLQSQSTLKPKPKPKRKPTRRVPKPTPPEPIDPLAIATREQLIHYRRQLRQRIAASLIPPDGFEFSHLKSPYTPYVLQFIQFRSSLDSITVDAMGKIRPFQVTLEIQYCSGTACPLLNAKRRCDFTGWLFASIGERIRTESAQCERMTSAKQRAVMRGRLGMWRYVMRCVLKHAIVCGGNRLSADELKRRTVDPDSLRYIDSPTKRPSINSGRWKMHQRLIHWHSKGVNDACTELATSVRQWCLAWQLANMRPIKVLTLKPKSKYRRNRESIQRGGE